MATSDQSQRRKGWFDRARYGEGKVYSLRSGRGQDHNMTDYGKQDFRWTFLFKHFLIRCHEVDQVVEQQEAEAK